jgi:hypothetical protein
MEKKKGQYERYRPRRGARIVETFDYTNSAGDPIFQCVKYEPKAFNFRRPREDSGWIWNLRGVEIVPYRLHEVLRSEQVFIVEGEKDADVLREKLGLVATTNPMGAGKWKDEYSQYFKDKDVIIIPDNDDVGKAHGLMVANSLSQVTENIKIIELPDIPESEDISYWIDNGGTKDMLLELIVNASQYSPEEPRIFTEETRRTHCLRIETLPNFLSRDIPPREPFIDPLIAKKELVILSGPPKLGKSLLSLNIALSLASGRNWLDFEVSGPIKILLIQQEVGEAALKERINKMLRADINFNTETETNNFLGNIAINSTRGVLLDTEEGYREICRAIEEHQPDLLILDPLYTFHSKRENSAEEMGALFIKIHELMDEYNISVFIIHHFGKPTVAEREGGELHRGSSIIGSASDSNWTFKRIPPNKYQTNAPRSEFAELSFELRNAKPPEPLILHRNSENLWYEMAELRETRKVTAENIRDIVAEHNGRILQTELLRTLKTLASQRLIKEAIYKAEERGYIFSRRVLGRGNPKQLFSRDFRR